MLIAFVNPLNKYDIPRRTDEIEFQFFSLLSIIHCSKSSSHHTFQHVYLVKNAVIPPITIVPLFMVCPANPSFELTIANSQIKSNKTASKTIKTKNEFMTHEYQLNEMNVPSYMQHQSVRPPARPETNGSFCLNNQCLFAREQNKYAKPHK